LISESKVYINWLRQVLVAHRVFACYVIVRVIISIQAPLGERELIFYKRKLNASWLTFKR